MRKKGLDHYFSILEGNREPNFALVKDAMIDVDVDKAKVGESLDEKEFRDEADLDPSEILSCLDLEDLWNLHEEKSVNESNNISLMDLKCQIAERILYNCHLCERKCGVDRREDKGLCGVDMVSRYNSEFLHYGEEPEIVPSHTIFFNGCTFSCVYCQNWDISIEFRGGDPVLPRDMAEKIVRKKLEGAKNINFVGGDPTPHLSTILKVLNSFSASIPVVWNSNMYMSSESMALLSGAVDVYLGDFRYGSDECAEKLSDITNYTSVVKRNFIEADRQADIIVRHLVLPGHLECCTREITEWCAENLGHDVRFNLMFQYRPEYQAKEYPEINRMLTQEEKQRALEMVKDAGLNNLVGT